MNKGEFKYRFSNAEITHIDANGNSHTYAVCDICGKEHQGNHGYYVKYSGGTCGGGFSRQHYCTKCANKILPILNKALKDMTAAEEEMRKDKHI